MSVRNFIYTITFLIILTVPGYGTDYWLRQQSPTLAWLHKISFTDSLNGWAAGDSGRIIHTSNGGQNWLIQNSGINFFIDDIFFINSRLGWGIANDFFNYGTTILHTTNGGLNWTSYRYPDTTLVLITVNFLDSLNGWLAGYDRAILQTTNGGLNWTRRQIDSGDCAFFPVRALAFYSPQYAFACGGYFDVAGHVLKTVNGGLNWSPTCVSFEPLFDIIFFDSLHLIATGGDYEYGANITKTTNGGINWISTSLNYFGTGGGISFRTRAEGWVPLGFSGTWTYTLDSGKNWNQLNAPDSSSVYDVLFTDSLHGWACGNSGIILKYNSGLFGINNQNQNYPQTNVLYQNYPNPFNPSTTIEFYVSKISRVRLVIYDLLGREVDVLLNETFRAGNHKIKFSAQRFASGLYFYELSAGDYSETKKLVILK